MATRQYIGARYVPLFADPAEWDSTKTYEPLTIVIHNGNSYTSAQYVPKGIDIDNEDFWKLTGNYNAQVEQYRKEVKTLDGRVEANTSAISSETTRAKAAESTLTTSISNETTRAKAAESTLTTSISNETTRAKAAETTLTTSISNETVRAKAEEQSLGAALNTALSEIHSPFQVTNTYTGNTEKTNYFSNYGIYENRRLFGQYENGTGFSVMANASRTQPSVMGETTEDIASFYPNRDTAAIYAENSNSDVNYTYRFSANQVTYSSTGATFTSAIPNAKVGMYVDAYERLGVNADWCVGKITAIDYANKKITVDGWWQQRDDNKAVKKTPSGVGCSINLHTKEWVCDYVIRTEGQPVTGVECGVFNTSSTTYANVAAFVAGVIKGRAQTAFLANGNFSTAFDASPLADKDTALQTKNTSILADGTIQNPVFNFKLTENDYTVSSQDFIIFENTAGKTITLPYGSAPYGNVFLIFNNSTGAINVKTAESITKQLAADSFAIAIFVGNAFSLWPF